MIKYGLSCDRGHDFEGWFSSAADFDRQAAASLVSCPVCGSVAITKQMMAPSVATGRQKDAARAVVMGRVQKEAIGKLKELVTQIRENSEDVGERFTEEARKIHYGETDARGIMGQATLEQAREMLEEGIDIAPLPALPDDLN